MRQLCWHEAWISIWRRRRPFKIKFSEFESVNNLLINDVSVPKTQLEDKWNIHFTSSWFISKFKAALEEEKVERCSVKLVQMIGCGCIENMKLWCEIRYVTRYTSSTFDNLKYSTSLVVLGKVISIRSFWFKYVVGWITHARTGCWLLVVSKFSSCEIFRVHFPR